MSRVLLFHFWKWSNLNLVSNLRINLKNCFQYLNLHTSYLKWLLFWLKDLFGLGYFTRPMSVDATSQGRGERGRENRKLCSPFNVSVNEMCYNGSMLREFSPLIKHYLLNSEYKPSRSYNYRFFRVGSMSNHKTHSQKKLEFYHHNTKQNKNKHLYGRMVACWGNPHLPSQCYGQTICPPFRTDLKEEQGFFNYATIERLSNLQKSCKYLLSTVITYIM